MLQRVLTLLFPLGLAFSVINGCDGQSPTPTNSSSPAATATTTPSGAEPSASANALGTDAPSSNGSAESASKSTTTTTSAAAASDANAATPSPAVIPLTDPQQKKPVVATKPQVAAVAAPVQQAKPQWIKPTVQVSDEEKKNWKRPVYDPMQLLLVQDPDDLRFVSCSACLADGKTLIMGGTKLVAWSIFENKVQKVYQELKGESDYFFTTVAIAPNGKWFVSGDSKGWLRIWSLETHAEIVSKQIYDNDVTAIAIDPSGSEIATLSYGTKVSVWNSDKLDNKLTIAVDVPQPKNLLYLKSGELAVAGESTATWLTATGKRNKTLSPGRFQTSLTRSHDDKWFAYGKGDGIQLYDVAQDKDASVLFDNTAMNELVDFAHDNKLIVSASGNGLRIWDAQRGESLQFMDAYGYAIRSLHWLGSSGLFAVVSESARVRVWGSTAAAQAANLKPLCDLTIKESSSSETSSPTADQLVALIDLRSYPTYPGAKRNTGMPFTSSYQVAASAANIQRFYQYLLGEDGWLQSTEPSPNPALMMFKKSGCTLQVSVYEAGPQSHVSLTLGVNDSARKLPRFDGAPVTVVYESDEVVMLNTEASVLDIEVNLLRKMHSAGWTAFSRLNTSQREVPEERNLMFLQGSNILTVGVVSPPNELNKRMIQCSFQVTMNGLPIPKDSGFVEFDGSTEPMLVANTSSTLEQTVAFYDDELKKQGWLLREYGSAVKEDRAWRTYVMGQKDLIIGIFKLDNGKTQIRVGDEIERSSWQLKKEEKPSAESIAGGVQAADLPLPATAKETKYERNEKVITCTIENSKLGEVGDEFTKIFSSLGWSLKGNGIRSDDYVFLTYAKGKGKDEIDLRIRLQDSKAMANIQGDGLLWDKELPGGKTITSYEAWLREQRLPTGLDLLDKFHSEMRSIK